MIPLPSIFTNNSVDSIPKHYQAEFWREILFSNVRRIRSLLLFSIPGFCALLYLVHVRNLLNLPEEIRIVLLKMQGVIFGVILIFALLFFARPMRSVDDALPYFVVLIRCFVVAVVLAIQSFVYTLLVTNGHPVFFFQIIIAWASALLIPPRNSMFLGSVMFGIFLVITVTYSPPSENIRFLAESIVSSAAITLISVLSSAILFRSTVRNFRQRKTIEEERNRVAELNAELSAAYLETDTMNHELRNQQKILEEQAMEIEIVNTRLQEQNETLVELNEEKSDFIGIVSHDLKNPIAAVRGLAEVLDSNDIEKVEMKPIIRQIISTAENMLELVKNLLDVHQLESGAWHFQASRFDIMPLVKNSLAQYERVAEQKHITFDCSQQNEKGLPAVVSADEQAMMQVLDNLISNAVKYSPHGKKVFVRIRHSPLVIGRRSGDDDRMNDPMTNVSVTNDHFLRIEVQDQGQGISSNDMTKLFGKFMRLSTRPTGGEHSTGLGLSIVKKMVEAMNGRVWCESEVGKGATFIVELPVHS
ncbi:MAG: ATP-binding protein [Candidatus Kapaibacteriota bacterium]